MTRCGARMTLLALATVLAACQATTPNTNKPPAKANATAPSATTTPRATTAGVPTIAPGLAPGPVLKLQPPSGGNTALKGTVRFNASDLVAAGAGNLIGLDGGSIVAAGGGNLIGLDGASAIANSSNQIVAAGAGNVIPSGDVALFGREGAPLIGLDGGTLIGLDGGTLVAAGAGNLVAAGAGNYHLMQAAGAASDRKPVAGLLVGAIDLRTHEALPLGVGPDSKPVFVVYSNAEGGFELFLPPGVEQENVLIVASPPGNRTDRQNGRLALNVVVAPEARGSVVVDEVETSVTDYLRKGLAVRLLADITAQAGAPTRFHDEKIQAILQPLIDKMAKPLLAAGLERLNRPARLRVLQAGLDQAIRSMNLATIPYYDIFGGRSTIRSDSAMEVLKQAMWGAIPTAEAVVRHPEMFAATEALAVINQHRPVDNPIRLDDPALTGTDLMRAAMDTFLLTDNDRMEDLMGVMLVEMGADVSLQDAIRISALSLTLFIGNHVHAGVAGDGSTPMAEEVVAATKKAMEIEFANGNTVEPPKPTYPSPPPGLTASLLGTIELPSTDLPVVPNSRMPLQVVLEGGSPVAYLADERHGVVWRVPASGTPTPLSRGGAPITLNPSGIALDTNGTMYVGQRFRHAIVQIKHYATVPEEPVAIVGTLGKDGVVVADDKAVPGKDIQFTRVEGLAVGPDGALYSVDSHLARVFRTDLGTTDFKTSVYAGGPPLFPNPNGDKVSASGRHGREGRFDDPVGLSFGKRGLYVVDESNGRLYVVSPPLAGHPDEGGLTTSLLGGGLAGDEERDGSSWLTRAEDPTGLAALPDGRVLIGNTARSSKPSGKLRAYLPGAWGVSGAPAGLIPPGELVGLAVEPGSDPPIVWVADARSRKVHRLQYAK